MITIHASDCTDFSNNGYGILRPTECLVEEKAGGIYQLTMQHPIDDSGRWLNIKTGLIISAEVPVRESPSAQAAVGAEREIYVVSSAVQFVSLKQTPSDTGKVIKRYAKGTEVVKLSEYDGYYQVSVIAGGKTGWMNAVGLTYLRTETETSGVGGIPSVIDPIQDAEQFFRIVSAEPDSEDMTMQVTAEHISYDLLGNPIGGTYKPQGAEAADAVSEMQQKLLNESDFVLHCTAAGSVSGDYSRRSVLDCIMSEEDGVLKQVRGRLHRDNFDIYILPDVERDTGFVVRYAKNLLGVSYKTDVSDVVTRIIPVGKDADGNPIMLTNPIYVDSPRINDYPTIRAKAIEYDVTVGQNGIASVSAARIRLKELAEADFARGGIDLPSVSAEVEFAQLGDTPEYASYKNLMRVHLYDTVTVIHPILGIDLRMRVVGYVYNVNLKRYESITLGDLFTDESTVSGLDIMQGSVSGSKIINNSITGTKLRDLSVEYAKLSVAAIDLLSADSITALIARINEIVAGNVVADDLYAAIGEIVGLKVSSLTASDIATDRLAAALAAFTVVIAGTADFDRATVQHLVAQALNLSFGTADDVFIDNLRVAYAQLVSAAIGNLVIRASDGNYYQIDVDPNGGVSAELVTLTDGEISAGQTEAGRIILATEITADSLNAANLLATYALINKIDAVRIDVDQLFAREAFIAKLTTSLIYNDTSLQMIIGAQNEMNRWFTFDDENGFSIHKPAYTDADGVEHPASIWRFRATETGIKIERTDMGQAILTAERDRITTPSLQVGEIVCKKTSTGGWVWTDA